MSYCTGILILALSILLSTTSVVMADKRPEVERSATPEKNVELDTEAALLPTASVHLTPLSILFKRLNLEAGYGLTERLVFGPRLSLFLVGKGQASSIPFIGQSPGPYEGYEAGIRSTLYLTRDRYQGGLLIKAAVYRSDWKGESIPGPDASPSSPYSSYQVKGTSLELLAGYQVLQPATHLLLDISGGINLEPTTTEKTSRFNYTATGQAIAPTTTLTSGYKFNPVIEISLGYPF